MSAYLTVTSENTKKFPIHSHTTWELMCYTEGNGYLKTSIGSFEFTPKTVIAIPPNIKHGSISNNNFVNICIHTDLTMHDEKIRYLKNASKQILSIFDILEYYYFSSNKYKSAIDYLIIGLKELILVSSCDNTKNDQVKKVYDIILNEFYKSDLNISEIIAATGYADDYFRTLFKNSYGTTPTAFLNKVRIDYAINLIKTYKNNLMINEIAQYSGFNDPLYFSRKFTKRIGISPKKYMREIVCNEEN